MLLNQDKLDKFIEDFTNLRAKTASYSFDDARKASTEFFSADQIKESIAEIKEYSIHSSEGHAIKARFYNPDLNNTLPLFLYFHRGGWVFGNIEEADPVCRRIARYLNCAVLSIDYRLAPENPFPKPFNDCYTAFLWAKQQFPDRKLIVGGESAGGNLASAVALKARDEKGPSIAAQVMIYPVINYDLQEDDFQNSQDQAFMTLDTMRFFWSMYIQNPEDGNNPYVSLNKADVHDLPPALIVIAEHDPLNVAAVEYGKAMEKAGNKVTFLTIKGVIHGCLDMPIYTEAEKINWLKEIDQKLEALCE